MVSFIAERGLSLIIQRDCVTAEFSYEGTKGIPSPPAPKLAPPQHYLGNEAAPGALPYESPPNPFLSSS